MSKGVTPENNANVAIWKALGPTPLGPTATPPGFFEKLGIPAPPANGNYFIGLRNFAQQNPNIGSADAVFDTMRRCGERPWTSNQQPGINSWLTANEKPLAAEIEGTKRTHYFSPLVPEMGNRGSKGLLSSLLPGAQTARELASALAARAMLYAGHGQPDAAWQDLLACHRLGRLVGRGGALLEGLVGMAIEQIACRADVAFLAATQPDAKHIEGYLRDLAALPPIPGIVEKVDLGERFTFLEHFMLLDRDGVAYLTSMGGGAGNSPMPDMFGDANLNGIDWNPALELGNKWFDRLAAALAEKDRGKRIRELDAIENDLRNLKLQVGESRIQQLRNEGVEPAKAKGQAIGEILVSLMMPAARKVQDASDRAAQSFENVAVAFVLAQYARDNGRYPATLEPLAKYLGRAPIDAFSGTTPVYNPTANGYLLYSVGTNGRDDAGRSYDDQPQGDDIVVRMPAVSEAVCGYAIGGRRDTVEARRRHATCR